MASPVIPRFQTSRYVAERFDVCARIDVRPLLLSFSASAPKACAAMVESRASDTGLISLIPREKLFRLLRMKDAKNIPGV